MIPVEARIVLGEFKQYRLSVICWRSSKAANHLLENSRIALSSGNLRTMDGTLDTGVANGRRRSQSLS